MPDQVPANQHFTVHNSQPYGIIEHANDMFTWLLLCINKKNVAINTNTRLLTSLRFLVHRLSPRRFDSSTLDFLFVVDVVEPPFDGAPKAAASSGGFIIEKYQRPAGNKPGHEFGFFERKGPLKAVRVYIVVVIDDFWDFFRCGKELKTRMVAQDVSARPSFGCDPPRPARRTRESMQGEGSRKSRTMTRKIQAAVMGKIDDESIHKESGIPRKGQVWELCSS